MKITRDENNRPYCYSEVAPHLSDLLKVKVERFTISKESQTEIIEILNLKNACTEDELRGIRNAVVVLLSQIAEVSGVNALEVMRSISGITAVIDNELWNKGYEV